MKKVAIVDVPDSDHLNKDMLEYIISYIKEKGVIFDVLKNLAELTAEHTHIVFISKDMCEIAGELKKENPEKIVILFTGGVGERNCLDHVITILTGNAESVDRLTNLIR